MEKKSQENSGEKAGSSFWENWRGPPAPYTPVLKFCPQGKMDPNWPQHFILEITKTFF